MERMATRIHRAGMQSGRHCRSRMAGHTLWRSCRTMAETRWSGCHSGRIRGRVCRGAYCRIGCGTGRTQIVPIHGFRCGRRPIGCSGLFGEIFVGAQSVVCRIQSDQPIVGHDSPTNDRVFEKLSSDHAILGATHSAVGVGRETDPAATSGKFARHIEYLNRWSENLRAW